MGLWWFVCGGFWGEGLECGVYIDISTHVKLFFSLQSHSFIGLCQKSGQDWCWYSNCEDFGERLRLL